MTIENGRLVHWESDGQDELIVPDGVSDIAEDAFDECGEKLTIVCGKGSAAEAFAQAHELQVSYE